MIVSSTSYNDFREAAFTGRYITNEKLDAYLSRLSKPATIVTQGHSVLKKPIFSVTLGTGPKKVLMWSQMHGNEATTTKAVIDLINFLTTSGDAVPILAGCTITLLPILNPDGAEAYTRENANQIDLNRDAQDRSQPESKLLQAVYHAVQPDFCFNLHDQRTIYNVSDTAKPATVSFLAPAHDEVRSISPSRGLSMQLIAAMNTRLEELIPGQIGRYDDAFNSNCIGDTFQMLGTPTILFEAGHFPEDYQREQSREYIFHALLTALDCIQKNAYSKYEHAAYFGIPENQKRFYDILVKNVPNSEGTESDIGILFVEVLRNQQIHFEPQIEARGDLSQNYGHRSFDYQNQVDLDELKATSSWSLLST